ncbi:hypothetical protein [Streptomyces sp. NPDC093223]|uniref:hypothetical protein n=1 Tax=Streptomyces sp. NPDC093223 TaxID=3366033 RepID=UPI00380C8393
MTAYARAHNALTSGKPLPPAEAAQLLADLRRETGEQLADAAATQLDGKFRRATGDTNTTFRKKQLAFAASMRVVQAVRHLAAIPRPSIPNPRTNGSTT